MRRRGDGDGGMDGFNGRGCLLPGITMLLAALGALWALLP